MGIITKNDILKERAISVYPVIIEEWGGTVYVRVMNGAQRDEWDKWLMERRSEDGSKLEDPTGFRARLVISTLCDSDGSLLLEPGDLESLQNQTASIIAIVFDEAMRVNGLSEDEEEEIEKN